MTGRPRRRGRALATALVAATALVGCASLPRSGPVTASEPELPAAQGIGLYARGPEAGATPEDIVDGFLAASAAGHSDEFLVAREFLTGPAVQTWQPLEQVRVFDEVPEYSRTTTGAVHLTVASEASVDSAGRYSESAPGAAIEAEFTLARDVAGEWRIIDLDDGVLLPAANFSSVYTQAALYFLTPDTDYLVPDVRWFPRQNLATSLVRNLLAGPSPWLAAGAVTMIPPGTRMSVESVAVADGVAGVDLSAEALVADEDIRALLYAQIERTLRGVPGVQDVEVTTAGAPVELTVPVPELPAYPFGAANVVVIKDGAPADVVAGEAVPRAGEALMAGVDPHHPALGYETSPSLVFLQGTDRLVSAPTAEAQPFLLAQGAGLVPPSIDREGWIWTTATPSDGHLTAVQKDGTTVQVGAPWLAGGKVHALRISREGARAVVVWESAGVLAIDLATVVRGLDGTPRTLGDPVRIGERMTTATELAWVDEQTVAVLGTSEGNPDPAVHLLSLGGPSSRLPAVAGAVTMTAGRGDRSILVGTEDGRVYERNGASWRPILDDVTYPTLPG